MLCPRSLEKDQVGGLVPGSLYLDRLSGEEPIGFLLNFLYAEISSKSYPKPTLFSFLAYSFSLYRYKLDLLNYLLTK